MSDSKYAPGVYTKGDVERVAHTARDAVALVFEGFKPKAEAPAVEAKVEEPVSEPDAPVWVPPAEETPKVEAPKPGPRKPADKKD